RDDCLIQAVAEARTMIDGLDDDQWYRPVLYFAAGPDTSEGCVFRFGARQTFDTAAPSKTLVQYGHQALVRMAALAAVQPQVRTAVRAAREDFDQVVRQLELMNDYKNIHDELHELYIESSTWLRPTLTEFEDDATVRALFDGYERSA